MARPDAVRRVKTYSAADGFVYQYYFFEGNRAQRGSSHGGEFTYVVSIDRQSAFPFKIFVHQSALEGWRSEERRVGKECRSRWSRDHSKKKINQETEYEV